MLHNPQLSDYELDERAAEATALLNHPLLVEAFKAVHDEMVDRLKTTQIGSPEALGAQAGLQALILINNSLRSAITTRKLRQKYGSRHDE